MGRKGHVGEGRDESQIQLVAFRTRDPVVLQQSQLQTPLCTPVPTPEKDAQLRTHKAAVF